MAVNLSENARNYVLELIRRAISAGEVKLPTEREIAAVHPASYGTIRLVTQQLEKEGFICKIRGSGTYIRPEAADLLRQNSWRKVWFFHAPFTAVQEPVNADINFGYHVLEEIRKSAEKRNWNLQTCIVHSHDQFLTELQRNFSPGDAILYLPPTEHFSPRQLGRLARYSAVPFVVIDAEFGDISISHVTTDNRFGGMLAARHLLENGFRHLTVLLSEPKLRQQNSRVQGFKEMAQLAGASVEIIDCCVAGIDNRIEKVYETIEPLAKEGKLPKAVFVTSDAGAFGFYEALKKYDFIIGKDVVLVGFDGVPYGKKLSPPLATVVQPIHEICDKAFEILENWVVGEHPQFQLYPALRPGESCTAFETVCHPRNNSSTASFNMVYWSPEK